MRSNILYPLVQLQGNNKIVLEHYLREPTSSDRYEVRYSLEVLLDNPFPDLSSR